MVYYTKSGSLFSPFFIFIRCAGDYSDADFLAQFGVRDSMRIPEPDHNDRFAAISDSYGWKMLADDWRYTLWHMPSTRPQLQKMAVFYDVLAGSIGDCDRSYELTYYQDGKLARHLVMEDSHLRGRGPTTDLGQALPGEFIPDDSVDPLMVILRVAEELGLDGHRKEAEIRFYGPT